MKSEPLRHLKYALAAAEHGSMRQVAQQYDVQESTVSRNICALEQQLDIQIFQRSSSGVRLTNEGRDWIEGIRGHYDGLEDALNGVSRRNQARGRLRIGLSGPFGRELLVRLIDRFEKTYPNIQVTIQDGAAHKQAMAIRRRHIDIAFMCACCEARACRSEVVWAEDVAALLPADHPLTDKAVLTWSSFAGERLLVPLGAEGPLLDPCIIRQITNGERRPRIEQCRACQATVMMKVQIGMGFMVTGASFAECVSIEGAVWRRIADSTGEVKAVWLDSVPKRAVLRLLGMARNMAKEHTPSEPVERHVPTDRLPE